MVDDGVDTEDDFFRWLTTADKASEAEFVAMFVRQSLQDAMYACVLAEETYDAFTVAAGWKPETRAALNAQGRAIGRVTSRGDRFVVEMTKAPLVQRAMRWLATQDPAVINTVYARTDERLRDWTG